MMKEMSIDLETYSDVNITKCGAYKYAESDEFEILLFGVSVMADPPRYMILPAVTLSRKRSLQHYLMRM